MLIKGPPVPQRTEEGLRWGTLGLLRSRKPSPGPLGTRTTSNSYRRRGQSVYPRSVYGCYRGGCCPRLFDPSWINPHLKTCGNATSLSLSYQQFMEHESLNWQKSHFAESKIRRSHGTSRTITFNSAQLPVNYNICENF